MIVSISEKLIASYAKIKPASWKDISSFASDEFSKETGINIEHISKAGIVSDEERKALLMEFHGNSYSLANSNYIIAAQSIYFGAEFMDSVQHPFDDGGLFFPIRPLTKASEVGAMVIGIPMNTMTGHVMGFGEDIMNSVVPDLSKQLKEMVPETNASNLLKFIELSGPLPPDVRQSLAFCLAEGFRGTPSRGKVLEFRRN